MPPTSTEQRRLAAIMFTDIVGYSAITQRDEALALKLLDEQKKILRPIFPRFDGREIETIGDAFFVEFSSALQATLCAVEIQRVFHDRNLEAAPGESIRLRIGLHVGDVVHRNENVHGDGVNIAARVQQVGLPGGICISEDVARQVQNKIDFRLLKLGKGELKNIRLPVDIYSVVLPWEKHSSDLVGRMNFLLARRGTRRLILVTALAIVAVAATLWMLPGTPGGGVLNNRIAVLPFLNISPDRSDEYFADGLTEELISNLSKIRDLSVIARTSVFKYKNSSIDIAEIGAQLNVGSILEGSVRKEREMAVITVNLTDVATQKNIWSEDYSRKITDVFALQAEISMRVARKLRITLLSGEEEKLRQRGTDNADAFRYYLRGRESYNRRTEESILTGIGYFNNAISLDTSFALAYAGLANCYTLIGGAGYTSFHRDTAITRARRAALRALEIDPDLAEAHASLAYVRFRLEWNFREAEAGFRRAIDLKPGFAKAHEWYGLFLGVKSRQDEALAQMLRAEELDPLSTSVSTGVGRVYHFRGEYDRAVGQFRKTLELDPLYAEARFALGMTLAQQGKYDAAIGELERAIDLSGGRMVMKAVLGYVHGLAGHTTVAEGILDSFRSNVDGPASAPYLLAVVCSGLGRYDEALSYLEQSYEERDGVLVYINVDLFAGIDRNNPRFSSLLEKIGLTE